MATNSLKPISAKAKTCQKQTPIDVHADTYKKLGSTFTAREGKWIGAKLGFFATADIKKNNGGYVDIY